MPKHNSKKACIKSQESVDCNAQGGVYKCSADGSGQCIAGKPKGPGAKKGKPSRKEIIKG